MVSPRWRAVATRTRITAAAAVPSVTGGRNRPSSSSRARRQASASRSRSLETRFHSACRSIARRPSSSSCSTTPATTGEWPAFSLGARDPAARSAARTTTA